MASVLHKLARSLEVRLLVPLAAMVALVLAVHALLGYWSVREQVARFVRADLERSTALIESAMHDGMLLNRMEEVQKRVERLGGSPGFTAVRVYAKDGRIALSARADERERTVKITDPACAACHPNGRARGEGVLEHRNLAVADSGQEIQRRLAIIRNDRSCATAGCHASPSESPVLGVLDVQMTMAPFDAAISEARSQLFLTTGALILGSGFVAGLFIRRLVHDPVKRLKEGTRRIAAGDLSTRIDVTGRHELAELAGAFNHMVGDLRAARDELDRWSRTLEEKVEEKTRQLTQATRQMTHVETMVSLGKLSATVAHELNNPLSGILTYARLVRRELADQPIEPAMREELDRYLAVVDKECARCGGIVKNLLVFARGHGVRLSVADINQIVDHSLMLVRHHLDMHHIRLESTPLAGDATLTADQGQIHQAMLALLMNAIEAMQAAPGREHVLSVRVEGDDSHLVIKIADTGVGIPAELLPRIFEPFVTTKGETSGVGLGLSVVYGVVHGHDGEITVQSQPGVGTTFTMTLPRRRAVQAASAEPAAPAAAAAAT